MTPGAPKNPDPDPPSGREVIAAARHFHRMLRTRLGESLGGFGLSYAQYEILEILEDEPKLHAAELARCLGITRQAAHRLVRELALADLVDVSPKDGRLRVILLTQTGTRRLATCRKSLKGAERAIEKLPADTRMALMEGLGAGKAALAPPPSHWWWD